MACETSPLIRIKIIKIFLKNLTKFYWLYERFTIDVLDIVFVPLCIIFVIRIYETFYQVGFLFLFS